MFYVYDIEGLRFRGPMEALDKVRKVERRAGVPGVKGQQGEAFNTNGNNSHQVASVYQNNTSKSNILEPLVRIEQIMTSPVITIDPWDTMKEAWQLLQTNNIQQLVVVTDNDMVSGMLADLDILKHGNLDKLNQLVSDEIVVGDVVGEDIITTDKESDIRRVAKVMAYYHVQAMPVTADKGVLAGIVTRGDILRGFAENPKLNLWA